MLNESALSTRQQFQMDRSTQRFAAFLQKIDTSLATISGHLGQMGEQIQQMGRQIKLVGGVINDLRVDIKKQINICMKDTSVAPSSQVQLLGTISELEPRHSPSQINNFDDAVRFLPVSGESVQMQQQSSIINEESGVPLSPFQVRIDSSASINPQILDLFQYVRKQLSIMNSQQFTKRQRFGIIVKMIDEVKKFDKVKNLNEKDRNCLNEIKKIIINEFEKDNVERQRPNQRSGGKES